MRPLSLILVLLLTAPLSALSAPREGPAGPAPLPWGTKQRSSHQPYGAGECLACHARKGPEPGPPTIRGDELCFSCHDQIAKHAHAFRHCTRCHNAHDSIRPHLLRAAMDNCRACHREK